MTTSNTGLKDTDWLIMGIPLLFGGLAILVVNVLGWRSRPESPWGSYLATFFYSHPEAALVLLAVGVLLTVKGLMMKFGD